MLAIPSCRATGASHIGAAPFEGTSEHSWLAPQFCQLDSRVSTPRNQEEGSVSTGRTMAQEMQPSWVESASRWHRWGSITVNRRSVEDEGGGGHFRHRLSVPLVIVLLCTGLTTRIHASVSDRRCEANGQ